MTVLPNDSSDTHELTIYINEQLSTTKPPKRLERNKIHNLGILTVPVSDTDAEDAAFQVIDKGEKLGFLALFFLLPYPDYFTRKR